MNCVYPTYMVENHREPPIWVCMGRSGLGRVGLKGSDLYFLFLTSLDGKGFADEGAPIHRAALFSSPSRREREGIGDSNWHHGGEDPKDWRRTSTGRCEGVQPAMGPDQLSGAELSQPDRPGK